MNEILIPESKNMLLEEPVSYHIKNQTFIVEPIFRKDGKETLENILLRLMQRDIENS